jgi:Uma2 family endonuclease
MAHPEPSFHTAEMVRALIDEEHAWPRYETLYGELVVTPAPGGAHNWIADRLCAELLAYLDRWPVGMAFSAPADVSWGRRDVLVQPDVFVVPMEQGRRAIRLGGESWAAVRHLLLAVEIVSPGSGRRDRFAKRVLYQRQGVEAYWVIDPERREAEWWTPDAEEPRVERERLAWHPAGADEPFAFDLAARFAVVHGERAP